MRAAYMGAPCALRCHVWNDEWYGREGAGAWRCAHRTKMQLQGEMRQHACESDMESEWTGIGRGMNDPRGSCMVA